MTTTSAPTSNTPVTDGHAGAPRALAQSFTLAWRNLLHIPRTPQLLVLILVQPIMFTVLFAYVFGGAITIPGTDYIDFLIPGIIVQTVAFGTTTTSVGLSEDLSIGLVDRFRSLPVARSAVLAGRVLADTARTAVTVGLIIVVGLLLGFDFQAGAAAATGMFALAVAFGLALSWVAALVGLRVNNPEAAQSAGFLWIFPLTFASSVFVSPTSMPAWLQAFAEANPMTAMADALRALALGGATASPVLWALSWIVAITAVFAPLAVLTYRRTD